MIYKIENLDNKILEDFLFDMESKTRSTIEDILNKDNKYAYFKNILLDNCSVILRNIGISWMSMYKDSIENMDYEINCVLEQLESIKPFKDITFNYITEYIDNYLDSKWGNESK